jgi:deoxyribodipyrimidine photolyase
VKPCSISTRDCKRLARDCRLCVFSTDQLLAGGVSSHAPPIECVDGLDPSAASMRAAAAFCGLVTLQHVVSVHFELCSEPYGSQRDRAVIATLSKRDMARISAQAAPLTYARFQQLFDKAGGAEAPLPAPTRLAAPPVALCIDDRHSPAVAGSPIILADGPVRSDEHSFLVGGETAGLARLAEVTRSAAWVGKFEKPKSSPYALSPPSTTLLSPYLNFGCVSPRFVYARFRECEALCKSHSEPPVSLVGQLLWREHFMFTAAAVGPRFGQIEGNPVCRQIPWIDDQARFVAWRDGMTGYPAIDAAMRQLRQEGWLHHLARHSVACFATRGERLPPSLMSCCLTPTLR